MLSVVALRRHRVHMLEVASLHYRLSLQRRGLRGLQLYLQQQRREAHCRRLAVETHTRVRVRRCWDMWLKRCEHNEELVLGALTRQARGHAAAKLTRGVLEAWVEYVVHRRHRTRLKLMADTHFRECALPK